MEKETDLALMPCPFCGEDVDLNWAGHEGNFFITCLTCKTTGPDGVDMECAEIQWNHREGSRFDS